MENFQHTFETRKLSFISGLSVCMSVPLKVLDRFHIFCHNLIKSLLFISFALCVCSHIITNKELQSEYFPQNWCVVNEIFILKLFLVCLNGTTI